MKSIFLKIVFMLTMAFFFSTVSVNAKPITHSNSEASFFYPSLVNLLNITPHEYTKLTGKKLTFSEVLKLKLTQSVFKKEVLKGKGLNDEPISQIIALLLCVLVGFLGIHRFYLGYTAIGIVQVLTFGGCLIWWIIDIILILTGALGPANGSDYYPAFEDN